MNDVFRVYEMTILPHQEFIFYRRDGELTCTTDLDHPFPTQCSSIWNGSTFTRYTPPCGWMDRIVMPVVCMLPQHLQSYIISNGLEIIKSIMHDEDLVKKNNNIICVTKEIENGLLAVGLCGLDVGTKQRNFKAEDTINRYLRLKAFW